MNWILVAFVFRLAANGDFDSPKMLYRGFPTEEACNLAGEHFREEFLLPESAKSASICIDKAAFDTKDWQILESPVADVSRSSWRRRANFVTAHVSDVDDHHISEQ